MINRIPPPHINDMGDVKRKRNSKEAALGGDNYLGRSLTIVLAGGEELEAA
jgi:hypothetical protein